MKIKQIIVLGIIAVSAISSCKKDSTTTPVTPVNTGGSTTTTSAYFAPTDANGILVAGNLSGTSLLSAQFFGTPSGNRVAAGSVSYNGNSLSQGTDTTYSLYSFSNLTAAGSTWVVAAGPSVSAINANYPTFASLPTITSAATIVRSSGFTVSFSPVTGADSIYVTITGTASKSKLIVGTASSCTFSASELSGLSATSSGQVNVGAWSRYDQTISGRKYYFYNNSTTIQSVVIQ